MSVESLYCRLVPHVQSSGTGKSRTHDELAKHIFYIPLNLAAKGATSMLQLSSYYSRFTHVACLAYPPRDPKVEEWFSASPNNMQQVTQNRCHAFLHALLSTTLTHLREICGAEAVAQELRSPPESRLATLASEFRKRMADGRTFEAHGPYRTKFYDAVFAKASKVMLPSFPRIQFLMSPLESGCHSTFHSHRQRRRRPTFNLSSTQISERDRSKKRG